MKLVEQILKDVKENPETWEPQASYAKIWWNGIKKDNVVIRGFGNTRVFSVIEVYINGVEIEGVSYLNRWRLEAAVLWWYSKVPLEAFPGD